MVGTVSQTSDHRRSAVPRSHAATVAELDHMETTAAADLFADERAQFMEQGRRQTVCHPIPKLLKYPAVDGWLSLWGRHHHRLDGGRLQRQRNDNLCRLHKRLGG